MGEANGTVVNGAPKGQGAGGLVQSMKLLGGGGALGRQGLGKSSRPLQTCYQRGQWDTSTVLFLLAGLRLKPFARPQAPSMICHSSQGPKARALPAFPLRPPRTGSPKHLC